MVVFNNNLPDILYDLLPVETVDQLKHLKENPGELQGTVAAGLQPPGLAKSRIDEQTLFDELERIWTKLGRQPTSTDITKGGVSTYSLDTYKRRFGGWRNALESFLQYINADYFEEKTDDILCDDIVVECDNTSVKIKDSCKKAHRKNIRKMYFRLLLTMVLVACGHKSKQRKKENKS